MPRIVRIREVEVHPAVIPSQREITLAKKIMAKEGMRTPLYIDDRMRIIHIEDAERFEAAKQLGWENVLVTDEPDKPKRKERDGGGKKNVDQFPRQDPPGILRG